MIIYLQPYHKYQSSIRDENSKLAHASHAKLLRTTQSSPQMIFVPQPAHIGKLGQASPLPCAIRCSNATQRKTKSRKTPQDTGRRLEKERERETEAEMPFAVPSGFEKRVEFPFWDTFDGERESSVSTAAFSKGFRGFLSAIRQKTTADDGYCCCCYYLALRLYYGTERKRSDKAQKKIQVLEGRNTE